MSARALLLPLLAALLAGCVPVDPGSGAAFADASASTGAAAVSVVITSPPDGGACVPDPDGTCPIEVSVTGADLGARGTCAGSQTPCGHLELYVDGTACGSPNTESADSNFPALFGRCPALYGTHALVCELRDDSSALLATSPTVTVQVQQPGEEDDGGD